MAKLRFAAGPTSALARLSVMVLVASSMATYASAVLTH